MDRSYYLNLNQQFQNARLSSLNKLERIQEYVSLIKHYKKQKPNSNLSELKLPISIDEIMKFISINPKVKHVFIRGNNGKYISGENGRSGMRCNHCVPLQYEKFIIEDVGNGKVALKLMNKYVSSEFGLFFSMLCIREKVGLCEMFEMIKNRDETFSFKGSNGLYVTTSDGRKIFCRSLKPGQCEIFYIQHISSLSEEIEIGWKLLNKHTNALCDNYDAAEKKRANINSEDFYYTKSIEVRHRGRGNIYRTRHEEKLFNQNGFKAAVKNAGKKVSEAQAALDHHARYINGYLNYENVKLQEITRIFNLCSPAISQLQNFVDKKESCSCCS